jgi:tRNA G18 (ribose-2'-O)-methylase SpoU
LLPALFANVFCPIFDAGRLKIRDMRKLKMNELGRLSTEAFEAAEKLPLVVVLDNVRSGLNVGSVFRTSDAFLVKEILLCGYTAVPPHRDVLKTALGSTESVQWRYFESTIEAVETLKKEGYAIWAVEQTEGAILLNEFQASSQKPLAIIFGNEVSGVEDHVLPLCDGAIVVPQFGTKHSLNISVCAGIVIWEIAKELLSNS